MKLLITGGTGFIGSRLALEAKRSGEDVVVTGASNTQHEQARFNELAAADIPVVLGQLQDERFAMQVVSGRTRVIHLAAAQHEANVPDDYFHAVNVRATRTLLEASVAAGVKRFVYGSTIGVYGAASHDRLDETTAPNPDNVYGRTKLEAENVVRSFTPQLETAIVRISETYGPGDFRLLKLFKAISRGAFVMIGAGNNRRQVIHVDDLVQGLLLASTHPDAPGEIFLLAGHEVMSTADMVTQIARALGKRPPRLRVPLGPLLAAAFLMEKTLKPLGISPPLHRRRLDFFRKSFLFSTDKAQRVLGFHATIPFSRGALQTRDWYGKNGYLKHD